MNDQKGATQTMVDVLAERSDMSRAFEAYWRGLPCVRQLPDYKSFDPLDIPELIPYLLVIEGALAPKRSMFIKMSGSEPSNRAGQNVSGIDVRELFNEGDLNNMWATATTMLNAPCGRLQHNVVRYEQAVSATTEMTLFPMVTDNPDQFAIISVSDRIGFTPQYSQQPTGSPSRLRPPDLFAWIDIGHGTPDKL